jgi:VanZ family protein
MKIRDFVAISYMALIFILSSLSQPPQPDINVPFLDKWEHLVEYAILGFLVGNSLLKRFESKSNKIISIILCAFIPAIYGLSDEIHQLFVPGRKFDLMDLLADAIGALIGVSIFILVDKLLSVKQTK